MLVGDKGILARGHTNQPGEPHAEAMALSLLPETNEEITAFVTLEPCSFHATKGNEILGGATGRVHFTQFYLDNLWVAE